MSSIDWIIIAGYCVLAMGIGVFLSRKATESVESYFVADRTFPWWVAGTSLLATSFAADTPLALTRILRTQGLQGNWYWWSSVMAFMMCACVFARMWQRGRFITDTDIYELRYSGSAAKFLRAYNAAHRSIFLNCITMGWVTLAMTKIIGILVEIPTLVMVKGEGLIWLHTGTTLAEKGITPERIGWMADEKILGVLVCVLIALSYAVLAGIWGVVATDLIQFFLAMIGSISLAFFSVSKLGGMTAMREKVFAAIETYGPGLEEAGYSPLADSSAMLSFMPDLSSGSLAVASFIIMITVFWWGGSEGGGFLAQRLFSCKNERHSMLAMLWFSFGHFVLRFWPWMIVGFASIAVFPQVADPEKAYPMMIEFLPVGFKGVMVASLLAAFMSTIDTHLNWGSSYLVNDLYKRFLVRKASVRHYVAIGQIGNVVLMLLAGVTAYFMESIYSAWLYLAEIGAGLVLASLLRWFWWRVNIWSEISAMISSLIIANAFRVIGLYTDIAFFSSDDWFAPRLLVILICCTIIWISVTFLTPPEDPATLRAFYERLRPPGFWGPVRKPGDEAQPCIHVKKTLLGWAAGTLSIYCMLIGVGKILFADSSIGWWIIGGGVLAGFALLKLVDFSSHESSNITITDSKDTP